MHNDEAPMAKDEKRTHFVIRHSHFVIGFLYP